MNIRTMDEADDAAVLALNDESVEQLSPLDAKALERHRDEAAYALVVDVDGEVAAFTLAYLPGVPYDSANYAWHSKRFDDFLYLDRITVGPEHRRRGIATLLYEALEQRAVEHGRMLCEVNSDPPNRESLAFHRNRGYRAIGHLRQDDGHETVMMEKPL